MHAGREAVVGGVGERDGLLERAHVEDREVGAEELVALVGRARAGVDAVHRGRRVAAGEAPGRGALAAQHLLDLGPGRVARAHRRRAVREPAAIARRGAALLELAQRGLGGERSQEDLVEGVPEGERAGDLRGALREGVGAAGRAHHDGAAGGGAALPRAHEGREADVPERLVLVGVLEDERGVLAAHLQRQQARVPQALPLEREAHLPAAGEEHAVHTRVARQRRALAPAALHEVEHARRHPGLDEDARVQLAHVGGHLAGLHHHGVAAGERGQHVAVGEVHGEVEGADHGQHAQGAEPALRGRRGQLLAGRARGCARRDESAHPGEALVHRDVGLGDHRGDLGARLPERLAHPDRDGVRQGLLVLLHGGADGADEGDPLLQGPRGPGGRRAGGRLHRPVDLALGEPVHSQELGEIGGRAVHELPLRTARLDELAPDEIHVGQIALEAPARKQKRPTRLAITKGSSVEQGSWPNPLRLLMALQIKFMKSKERLA